MKRLALLLAGAGLLASCAPTLTTPVTGRIVNTTTGQEGTISFTRGTLKPRLDGPNAPDNVTINIAGQTFTGRTVILNSTVSTVPEWSTRFDWVYGNGPWDSRIGVRTGYGTPTSAAVTRAGNLIARSTSTPARTLTCTLNVDVYEHGIGDCIDGTGNRYALQF